MAREWVSPPSAIPPSSVRVDHISPHGGKHKTIGFTMDREAAINLATGLLSCACDRQTEGPIRITGHRKDNRVTVITR
ncbi:MAG: hypothetical protein ACXABY_03300 [Candidatus Thorarchaeota archaeon]|jgi:hypothetical protein